MHQAIVGRDPEAAVALVDGYTGPRADLERALIQSAAQDHSTAPIMVAHVVKTAQAAVTESRALGDGPGSSGADRGGGPVPGQPEAGAVRLPVHAGGDHDAARCPEGRVGPGPPAWLAGRARVMKVLLGLGP